MTSNYWLLTSRVLFSRVSNSRPRGSDPRFNCHIRRSCINKPFITKHVKGGVTKQLILHDLKKTGESSCHLVRTYYFPQFPWTTLLFLSLHSSITFLVVLVCVLLDVAFRQTSYFQSGNIQWADTCTYNIKWNSNVYKQFILVLKTRWLRKLHVVTRQRITKLCIITRVWNSYECSCKWWTELWTKMQLKLVNRTLNKKSKFIFCCSHHFPVPTETLRLRNYVM